jgi:hypothetical protein
LCVEIRGIETAQAGMAMMRDMTKRGIASS